MSAKSERVNAPRNRSTLPRLSPASDRPIGGQVATFDIVSSGSTQARVGTLSVGNKIVRTPVVWLGHSLKSRVRFTHSVAATTEPLPILVNFAELRRNSTALKNAKLLGLHHVLAHQGPILLDSGGYQFQKMRSIDLCPHDLATFYDQCGADIVVALDHPLSPTASRTTNNRRLRRSLENLAAMRRASAQYALMPVVHGYTIGQVRRSCEQIGALIGTPCMVGIGSMVPLLKASHIGGRFRYRRDDGSVGSQVDFIADAIGAVREAFPASMLHVFGAGGVPTVLALFAAGADSCDSAAWRLKASYGAIQLPGTSDRFLQSRRSSNRVRRVTDANDIAAIGKCSCSACGPLPTVAARRAQLNKYFAARAAHNAHVLTAEINSFRAAVRARRDHEWLISRLAISHRLRRLVSSQPRF
jgi:7-cyano-7-deazaguanine tRNA-ribosyltransferase